MLVCVSILVDERRNLAGHPADDCHEMNRDTRRAEYRRLHAAPFGTTAGDITPPTIVVQERQFPKSP
jgi:hypothetical protein